LTGGNRNDITQLIPLLQAVPPVRGKRGRPRRRPDVVLGDRGYDHDKYRRLVWDLGVKPVIARRGTDKEFKAACGAGEILLDRRTAVRGALPLREEGVRPQRMAKGKGKEVTRSLPLSMYSAPGGLRQDPGRVAESPAEAKSTRIRDSRSTCAFCPRVGLAGRRTAGGTRGAVAHSVRRCGCARRRTARSGWPNCNLVEWGVHD